MRISDFKKLEKKIIGQNFGESYKGINIMMNVLSYLGNIGSIFLAYFFMSKVISSAIENVIGAFIFSIIILIGIELLKRDIFDKFSISFLKDNRITKEALPLLIFSLMLISASFYSTLTGANEFSSKSEQIDDIKSDKISKFNDSITKVYDFKINPIEIEISNNKIKIEEKDKEQSLINKSLQDKGYLSRSERERNNQLSEEKKFIDNKIKESDDKIVLIKTERDDKISLNDKKVSTKTDSDKKDNNKSSFIFVIISTIIEFIILGGVFFNQYYKFRTYREFKEKIDKDPNYQKWELYDRILSIIYPETTLNNQKLPSNKSMVEMCKVNGMIILPRDMINFLKIITSLEIIKSSGSSRYINKSRELSFEVIKKHFNIE